MGTGELGEVEGGDLGERRAGRREGKVEGGVRIYCMREESIFNNKKSQCLNKCTELHSNNKLLFYWKFQGNKCFSYYRP